MKIHDVINLTSKRRHKQRCVKRRPFSLNGVMSSVAEMSLSVPCVACRACQKLRNCLTFNASMQASANQVAATQREPSQQNHMLGQDNSSSYLSVIIVPMTGKWRRKKIIAVFTRSIFF